MIIQVEGVGFNNKGAELMARAIICQVAKMDKNNITALALRVGNYGQRARAGFYHVITSESNKFPPLRILLETTSRLIPASARRSLHFVTNAEVEIILDASGFAYSDFWSGIAEFKAKKITRWKREGKKIILLPQAFGPFENPSVRKAMLEVLAHSDLIFARDQMSYDYLVSLNSSTKHVKVAPDFTNLVEGQAPKYFDISSQPCIIPNYNMLAKTSGEIGDSYPTFLVKCCKHLLEKGMEPFILIHETGDRKLAEQLQAKVGQPFRIIVEPDPVHIKGILGTCSLVISSRYHGLVSALSQGVPSLGTGWSHKYQSLFEDYNCLECLVSPLVSDEILFTKMDILISEPSRSEIIKHLTQASMHQKRLATGMWKEIDILMRI